jgi:Ser/Thr protein kinase RdoA (MazF antagonist)
VTDGLAGQDNGLWCGHVPMGEPEAERLAADRWGLTGRARRVATEKDDTFVLDGDGVQRVLKVTNPAERLAELDLEVPLLRHIATTDPTLVVPRVYPDRTGAALAELTDAAGQHRYARLLSYIPGTPLDSTGATAAERELVGQVLGRLRHATAGFSHPAQHRILAWDVQHLDRLRPLLAGVPDPGQRELLAAALARFDRIVPLLPGLRRQMLHNDFSTSNVIVDRADPRFVHGVIDFGDAVYTAIAVDVATALLNQLVTADETGDAFAHGRDLLRGYLTVADLTTTELAVIPYLVLGRVIARALITLRRVALMPANAGYVLRNTERGWAPLRWFLAQPDELLETTLMETR